MTPPAFPHYSFPFSKLCLLTFLFFNSPYPIPHLFSRLISSWTGFFASCSKFWPPAVNFAPPTRRSSLQFSRRSRLLSVPTFAFVFFISLSKGGEGLLKSWPASFHFSVFTSFHILGPFRGSISTPWIRLKAAKVSQRCPPTPRLLCVYILKFEDVVFAFELCDIDSVSLHPLTVFSLTQTHTHTPTSRVSTAWAAGCRAPRTPPHYVRCVHQMPVKSQPSSAS